jgi:hypothetical protein
MDIARMELWYTVSENKLYYNHFGKWLEGSGKS